MDSKQDKSLTARLAKLEKELVLKNHELEIEAALEHVRSRTMAMQRSEELSETAYVLYQQFIALGEKPLQITIGIIDPAGHIVEFWGTDLKGNETKQTAAGSLDEPFLLKKMFAAWKMKKKSEVIVLSGNELGGWVKYRQQISSLTGRSDESQGTRYIHFGFFSKGAISISADEKLPEGTIHILERFASVFDGTYTRFLDLQKAEAQAREGQIQLALERVRARTMAMHNSDELTDVAALLFKQVSDLGIKTWTTGFNVWSEDNNSFVDYITSPQGGFIEPYTVYAPETKLAKEVSDARKNGDEFLVQYAEGEVLKETYLALSKLAKNKQYEKMLEGGFQFPSRQVDHFVFGSKVSLMFITYEPVPEFHDVFKRFGKVFEQTYTRFLDLQKAEAQARESQIQLGLERVRAAAMAMHDSNDVGIATALVFSELYKLGITTIRCGVCIINDASRQMEVWSANSSLDGQVNRGAGKLDMTGHPLWLYLLDAWRQKIPSFSYELRGKELADYYQAIKNAPNYQAPENLNPNKLQEDSQYCNCYIFNEGCLFTFTTEPFLPEISQVLEKFVAVFGLTYRRYLDLTKAEAQAREAQIEASLERVRSKTMAMHNSQDVADTSVTMFQELVKLGVEPTVRCGVSIISSVNDLEVWTASLKDDGSITLDIGRLDMTAHPLLMQVFSAWQNKEPSTTYELTGDAVRSYFQALNDAPGYAFQYPMDSLPEKWGINAFFFPEGCLFAFTGEPLSLEMSQVFKRFAGVFGQTYTRFLDLQKAEAQAKEAQIEAALERVRSRTLAMQRSDELAETAVVLFRQMISLGIEPNRLYIGLTQEENNEIEFWITDEDGSKVSNMFTGDADKNVSMKKMHDAWKAHQKSIVIDMHGDELTEYLHYLGEILHVPFKGGLAQKRRVTYISFFSNGFIGMASPGDQPQETINLLDRFAYVFNLTYARFNDLKIAEKHAIQAEQDLIEIKAAKKRAEDTLTDLRVAQKQLVQSEKMASLGELTAGIAHEIQNPLNFVNNFSEVSAELIDEMTEELDKGDIEEVKAIAGDIRDNLEKIRHHGKRADVIVKGMLQHSRSSSGQKEPTDLNVLADEYLRLSYHGLRAKDKAFNAELVTNFDKDLPRVSVVPQDMGRVMLNLINNAFYATQQKQKIAGPDYKPTVEVNTQVSDDQVLISVKDNGIGIPESIKDKILQPFFTTKPTGEGTGLGLSLSYDIVVKGHNGKINIESKEGEGSEFIIDLSLV